MTSSSKWQSGVLVLMFCLSVAGLVWPSSATAEGTAVSLPVETVADYLYAMIEADREVYTKHVVERMQIKGVVVASENWEEKNTLPLPAQFLMESGRVMARKNIGIQYRLISLWPINKRNVARSEIVAVELEPLAAADIFGEDEVIAIRSVVSAGDAIRKECKLGARSARHFDEVHLWHVGKAGGNEHFAPCRVPILEAGGAELAILVSLLSDRRRNRRNVFHHQVVARSNDCWLGGRILRNSGGSEQQKNEDYRVALHIDLRKREA